MATRPEDSAHHGVPSETGLHPSVRVPQPQHVRRSPGWVAAGAAATGVLIGGVAVYLGLHGPDHLGPTPQSRSSAPVTPALADTQTAAAPRKSLSDAVAQTRDAVVNLHTARTQGAGVIVTELGIVVTNYHVIADAMAAALAAGVDGRAPVVSATFESNRELPAEVVFADREEDLAVLRLLPASKEETFSAAKLGRSQELQVGDDVFAFGNPPNLPHTVSRGIVSAVDRTGVLGLPVVQLDASINVGDSGGPLFNRRGELVGIVTARSRHAQGIGFALPIDHVRGFLRALREGGRGGVIGVMLQPVAGKELEAVGYRVGLQVADLTADGPAARAGLHKGDIIVELRGKRLDGLGIKDPRELGLHLQQTVRKMFAGETLEVSAVREGVPMDFDVEVGSAGERLQAVIDAEQLLGLRLIEQHDPPMVEAVVGDYPAPAKTALRGATVTGMMGADIEDLDTLGRQLARLRDLSRRRLSVVVTVGFKLADESEIELPVRVR